MNSDPLFLVLVGYGAMVVLMLVLWGVQVVHRNASIADVGFCAGLVVVVLWYARYGFGDPERKLLVAIMVCVYAGRLGLFLESRPPESAADTKREDRYRAIVENAAYPIMTLDPAGNFTWAGDFEARAAGNPRGSAYAYLIEWPLTD